MRKETITYTDYEGNQRTEDFYFNLSKAEVIELEMSWDGGLQKVIKRIIDEKDQKRIIEMFKMIILKSYGEKSLDGRKFVKKDASGNSLVEQNFVPTEAYSELFMSLATDTNHASDFINDITPKNLGDEVGKVENNSNGQNVLPGPGADTK